MANINSYFPEREKGWALGLNAGGGNIGVATVQLVGLAVIALFTTSAGYLVPLFYAPLILPDAATAGTLRSDPGIAGAFAHFDRLTTAVVAIGGVYSSVWR